MPFGRDLVMRGSEERLAPILMTALATGLALVPIVLGGSRAGYEIEHPLAVVILGGLVTSTLLNLFIVPALYLRYGRLGSRPTSDRRDVTRLSSTPACSDGKRHDEGRAAGPAALELQRAAMRLGDPSGNRQPETGAVRFADPHEPLEDPLLIGRLDAWAVVRDPKHHVIGRALERRRSRSPSASAWRMALSRRFPTI